QYVCDTVFSRFVIRREGRRCCDDAEEDDGGREGDKAPGHDVCTGSWSVALRCWKSTAPKCRKLPSWRAFFVLRARGSCFSITFDEEIPRHRRRFGGRFLAFCHRGGGRFLSYDPGGRAPALSRRRVRGA